MNKLTDNPLIVFAFALLVLWLSARIGSFFLKRRKLEAGMREDLSVILAATLTLLGLIIGFSFSMAISRYEQRQNCEGAEANAIGTEYLRADLLPAADAARVHALLRNYVDERILFYNTRDEQRLRQINATTAQLQIELWNAIRAQAAAQPTPVVALVISGSAQTLTFSAGYGNSLGLGSASLALPALDVNPPLFVRRLLIGELSLILY